MPTIHLEGGPADGQSFVLSHFPYEFYVATPLLAFSFFASTEPREKTDRKWTYARTPGTNRYVCTSFEPVEEAINAVRNLGLTMDDYQERMFRDWWREP